MKKTISLFLLSLIFIIPHSREANANLLALPNALIIAGQNMDKCKDLISYLDQKKMLPENLTKGTWIKEGMKVLQKTSELTSTKIGDVESLKKPIHNYVGDEWGNYIDNITIAKIFNAIYAFSVGNYLSVMVYISADNTIYIIKEVAPNEYQATALAYATPIIYGLIGYCYLNDYIGNSGLVLLAIAPLVYINRDYIINFFKSFYEEHKDEIDAKLLDTARKNI